MSEGSSRNIWDIFAHGNKKDISHVKEKEKGVDVEGPGNCPSSHLSVSSGSLEVAYEPKRSRVDKRFPKKDTNNTATKRRSPRKHGKPDNIKTENSENETECRAVSTDLKKGFEKLRTKVKPPVTTSDTETGIDDFQLKRRHYVKKGENIHSAVDTKEEPPDKIDFPEKSSKCQPETKYQSRHSNIFERMPILFDAKMAVDKESKGDVHNILDSYLKRNEDPKKKKSNAHQAKTIIPKLQNGSPREIRSTEVEIVKLENKEMKPSDLKNENSEFCEDSDGHISAEMEQKAEIKLKKSQTSVCGEQENLLVQKQRAKIITRGKGNVPKSLSNKGDVFHKTESVGKASIKQLDFIDISEESSVEIIDFKYDISSECSPSKIEKAGQTDEMDLSSDFSVSETMNKSGEDYIVLDSVTSQSDTENSTISTVGGDSVQTQGSTSLRGANNGEEKVKVQKNPVEILKVAEKSESSGSHLVSPLRRSSRKVKVKQFPDSIGLDSKRTSNNKRAQVQKDKKALAPELPLDLSIGKESDKVQHQKAEHLNKVSDGVEKRESVFSVLDKISGVNSFKSQESSKEDVANSNQAKKETAVTKPEEDMVQQTPKKLNLENVISGTSDQVCDKHVLSSFEQNRPLCILGTTKKKIIVAEVKPNNAAVLTFPSPENSDERSGEKCIALLAMRTSMSPIEKEATEQELPEVHFDETEAIVPLETSHIFPSVQVNCLGTALVFNIVVNKAVNIKTKVEDEPKGVFNGLQQSSQTPGESSKAGLSQNLKVVEISDRTDTHTCENVKHRSESLNNMACQETDLSDSGILNTGAGSLKVSATEDKYDEAISCLPSTSSECNPQNVKEKLVKTEPVDEDNNCSETGVENIGMKLSETLRRSSRMVKPTTKVLEQLEIDLTLKIDDYPEKRGKTKFSACETNEEEGNSHVQIKDLEEQEAKCHKSEQSLLHAEDVSLTKGHGSINVSDTLALPVSREGNEKREDAIIQPVNVIDEKGNKAKTAVHEFGSEVETEVPSPEKPVFKWKKCEHKGEKEPGTFVMSKNKLVRQSQSFFQEKGVPFKFKKSFKSYMCWRHKQGVITNMLPPEQIKTSSVRFQKPKDTDIRIKELKLGQSWKDHLFDHKTQVLKMPKTLVYIPKSDPEDLSFDVPQQFILAKSQTIKPTSSKQGKLMFKSRKSLDETTVKDDASSMSSCTTVASKQKTQTKKKNARKRKQSGEITTPSTSEDGNKPANPFYGAVNDLTTSGKLAYEVMQGSNYISERAENEIENASTGKIKGKKSKVKSLNIPNSGVKNKNLDNVIAFSKFLRQSEGDNMIENDSVVQTKSVCSSPSKLKEKKSKKLNRRVESVRSALHEITKQKVIRKLTGQTPVLPQKNSTVKKVVPLNCMTELPPLVAGHPNFLLPGKAMSVEIVEVERTADGEMVLHTPVESYKRNLQKSPLLSTNLTAPKSLTDMTDVSALLNSYLEQQKRQKDSKLPEVSETVSLVDYNDRSSQVSRKEELKISPGKFEVDSVVIEPNNDHDTTISYNECVGQEGLCEDLFEDVSCEQHTLPEEECSTLDANEITSEDCDLPLDSRNRASDNDMLLLSPTKDHILPESHSTPRRSPRRLKTIETSPVKTSSPKVSDSEKITPFLGSPQKLSLKDVESKSKEYHQVSNCGGETDMASCSSKPLKRSLLKELTSSEGYIADKITKTSDSLFDDPSRLSREERALQRAILAFSEMELKKTLIEQKSIESEESKVSKHDFHTAMRSQKEKDNAKKKANQIKKNAVKRSNQNIKKEKDKIGFRDFIPKILESRTRSHNSGEKLSLQKTVTVRTDKGLDHTETSKFCSVCGGGVYVQRMSKVPCCGACRLFYTRCLKLGLKYECHDAGHCHISPDNRSKCAGCRQQKCRQVGLEKSIKIEGDSKQLKQRRFSDGQQEKNPVPSTPCKKLKLDLSDKKTYIDAPSSSQLLDDDDLPELSLSAVEQFSGKGQSKGSTPKGKSWKQKKSTPKSAKQSKLHNNSNTSAIVITDDEDLDIMETSKPIVYIDRADLPSPDFGNLCEGLDDNDSMFDPLDTISISTTMSVDGCRVKIPPEVKKISVNRDSGESVLHKAARLGYRDVVLWCCQTGYADPKGQDYAGFAPIHECCAAGEIEITKILLAYGADVNVASKVEGVRPLHDAVQSDHIEMVRLVLSCGGDPNLSTYSGKTLNDLIKSDEMKSFLQDYMIDVNSSVTAEERKPWQFRDFLIEGEDDSDVEELGQSIFDDAPSDSEDTEFSLPNDINFEMSESPMIPVYSLTLDLVEGNYALLHDIMETLDMTKLEFTRQIEAHIHTASYESLQECLGGREIPIHYEWSRETARKQRAPVDLVKWDGQFQELLGIEEVTINAVTVESVLDKMQPTLSMSTVRQWSFTPLSENQSVEILSDSGSEMRDNVTLQPKTKSDATAAHSNVRSSHLVKYFNMISPDRSTLFAFQDESFEHLSSPECNMKHDKENMEHATKNDNVQVKDQMEEVLMSANSDKNQGEKLTSASSQTSEEALTCPLTLETPTVTSNKSCNVTGSNVLLQGDSDIALMAQYYKKVHNAKISSGSDTTFTSSNRSGNKDQNWNQFNLFPKGNPVASECADYDDDEFLYVVGSGQLQKKSV